MNDQYPFKWLIILLFMMGRALAQSDTTKLNEIPQVVGPMYMLFPHIDSLINVANGQDLEPQSILFNNTDPSKDILLSTGSVFRAVSVSPLGGAELTGGLRMQLQGQLSETMQISGILSDEQSPIQPEGNTQSLEEIDQIYIQINHPRFQMDAGDIILDFDHGKYINSNKRLVGLNSHFNKHNWSGGALFSWSKGQYRQKEFKGTEGKQGPYFLDSETGNRNIVILAGTERVWLDGSILVRGENHDYTIDYSTAEVYFTPKHIIHSDSDIIIEYQYTDFQYTQNVTGGKLKRKFSGNSSMSISWLRQNDQTRGAAINLSDKELNLLETVGDENAEISGAIPDATGDYILDAFDYYIYQPKNTVAGARYTITFSNDNEKGEYRRLISPTGAIYYEFIPPDLRDNTDDLYSPVKTIVKPRGLQVFELSGNHMITKNTEITYYTAASDLDNNLVSSVDDGDNEGLAYSISLNNPGIPISNRISWQYKINSWQEDARFQSMERVRSALFYTDWNINPEAEGVKQYNEIESALVIETVGQGTMSASSFSVGKQQFNRLFTALDGGISYIPLIATRFNKVEGQTGRFLQRDIRFQLLPGAWHPYIDYRDEEQEDQYKFWHRTVGITYAKDSWQGGIGIGERTDFVESDSTRRGMEKSASGIFGSFDLAAYQINGGMLEITIRRRIKEDNLNDQDYNFTLARVRTLFQKPQHPLRWDMKTTLEETYTETRALVYDSVGVGLGDYRYDPDYNEYVSDPKGDYIAYTIFTGDRYPATKVDALQLFDFDFRKTSVSSLRNVSISSEFRTILEGRIKAGDTFFNPDIGDTLMSRANWFMKNEIIYRKDAANDLWRIWQRQLRHMNGLDNRGQEIKFEQVTGLNGRHTVNSILSSEMKISMHNRNTRSTISELRDRVLRGYWLAGGTNWGYDLWTIAAAVNYGQDKGQHQGVDFAADAIGVRLDLIRFLGKKGRIQGRVEWYETQLNSAIKVLPPEALDGLAVGTTFRSNLQGQMLIGKGISINTSLNYIRDTRYNNFLTLNGEIRAYF